MVARRFCVKSLSDERPPGTAASTRICIVPPVDDLKSGAIAED